MPLISIHTSARVSEEVADALLPQLSQRLADLLEKPERYVMTCLHPPLQMTLAGTSNPPCAFVEVKSIGSMTPEQTRAISGEVCTRLEEALGVAPARTYLEFSDVARHMWGHDGTTFA